jgi:hypothetical protein
MWTLLLEHPFLECLFVGFLFVVFTLAYFLVQYRVYCLKRKVRRDSTGNVICLESARRKRRRRDDRVLVRRSRPDQRRTT